MLSLRFNRDVLNEASARHEWKCTWNFGPDANEETGWEVFHIFEQAGNCKVIVTITDLTARPVTTSQPLTTTINVHSRGSSRLIGQPPVNPVANWLHSQRRRYGVWSTETWLELTRTGIVLALAMFGLMATARQQVESLTFLSAAVAIIALCFGVDTAKNLVAPPSNGRPLA